MAAAAPVLPAGARPVSLRRRGRAKGCQRTPGSGRKPGTPNKATAELRDLVLGALDRAGGEKYLVRQARRNPAAFLGLLGKCLPRDITITGSMTWAAIVDAVAAARAPKALEAPKVEPRMIEAQAVRVLPAPAPPA